jgi:hypothetical protein
MGIWALNSVFSAGELDPLLLGRVDLEAYYRSVQEATNVLSIPQGGLKKRPGTQFISNALGDGRLQNFAFSTGQTYLLSFTLNAMEVYKNGILQTSIVTPFNYSQVTEFDYIQSADTIIITHPDDVPQFIQRQSDVVWTIAPLNLSNIPQYDYNDASSPVPTDCIQRVDWQSFNNGDIFKLSLAGILTEEIAFSQVDMATTADNMVQALLELPNTGNSGVSAVVINAGGGIIDVTFSGQSADDFDAMVAVIVSSKDSAFEAAITVTQAGTSPKEDVWSVVRGWPRTCTFHESRLWFGGSTSRPATLWGSVVGDVFNFDAGRARDDQGIDITLATDQINAITGIVSNRTLQVFTTGAEFHVPASPITPSTAAVKPQTNLGSKRVRPVVLEGLTMFLQRTGKALYQFQFLDEFQSNESRSLSLIAPHLINDPVQMAVSRGSTESDANYVYLVGSDGKLTVFNSQSFEGVQAFTRWETDGEVKSVAVVDDTLYLLVLRDGVFRISVENLALNTDEAVLQNIVGDVVTGLGNLEGKTVKVKAEGTVQLNKVVTGGQITLDREVSGDVEVGLEYLPMIRTMPLNIDMKSGPNAAQKKRILRCAIRLDNSNGVLVNDQRISDRVLGVNQFSAPQPQSQFRRVFLHGWSLDATVTITQDAPFPMTVLALALEVKV